MLCNYGLYALNLYQFNLHILYFIFRFKISINLAFQTNFMPIWVLALVIVLGLIIYLLYKYGVLDKFQMHQDVLDASQVLYISYRGPYEAIGKQFEKLDKKTSKAFSISNCFGFYYDNPQNTRPQDCRSVIGVLVNKGEQFKIKQFKKKNPQFRQRLLSRTKCLSYYMPYVNTLSFLVMVKKVYPAINQYIKKQQVFAQNAAQGMMQVYRFGRAHKQVDIVLCLQNKEQFEMYYEYSQDKQPQQKMFLEREVNEPNPNSY